MGYVKNVLMPEALAPWASCSGHFVCGKCFKDYALAAVVKKNAVRKTCDYCGRRRRTAFAADLSVVVEHMYRRICRDYTHPAAELRYESAEGGFQGEVLDGDDLLRGHEFTESDELFHDVCSAFNEDLWCRRRYFSPTPQERHRYGWEGFMQAVKHERRYTFWSMDDDDTHRGGHPAAGKMLEEIATQIRRAGLIKTLKRGKAIWRVRVHDASATLTRDHELSPPPVASALKSNRMSPAGIVMFYGADDFETARVETVDAIADAGKAVTGGRFNVARSLRILDLHELPPMPSYFDGDKVDVFRTLLVLRDFARDLAQPVPNDGRASIEYVPTQAFTEYVRFQIKTRTEHAIDGIRYQSSKNGGACYVLFCGQQECIEHPDSPATQRWLRLDPKSLRTVVLKNRASRTTKRRSGRLISKGK